MRKVTKSSVCVTECWSTGDPPVCRQSGRTVRRWRPRSWLVKGARLQFGMIALIAAFVVALIVTLGVVRFAEHHGHHSFDHDTSGPQKFHAHPVPRVGGVGIVVGLVVAMAVIWAAGGTQTGRWGLILMSCGAPAFLVGLAEDITKRISPTKRLAATVVSALLAFWLLGAGLNRTEIPGVDWVVGFAVGSAVLTVFSVAGIANSVNIIDGFNGLASMCVVIMLAAIAYVGYQVEDHFVAVLALAGIGAVLGFFVWNFPAGLIFLGDGGAYFLGFFVAELSIMLLVRNGQVSPFFPLLVCIYPVFETLFSIYRRRFIRDVPPSMPDGIHLHSLIYRRVLRWAVGSLNAKSLTRRNSMTSPYLWLLCMFSVVPSVLFWDNSTVLLLFLLLFGLSYVVLYWRIVRFKAPRWLHYPTVRVRRVPGPKNRRR
jgi:UDP-N-acetylmuramyl pentapeptide phosphotransferase/UDP-N-acetylglucosamine-1-phosphate transferase